MTDTARPRKTLPDDCLLVVQGNTRKTIRFMRPEEIQPLIDNGTARKVYKRLYKQVSGPLEHDVYQAKVITTAPGADLVPVPAAVIEPRRRGRPPGSKRA